MPCFRPLTAWRTNFINPETGKRGITFSRSDGHIDMELKLPCGKCLGCKSKTTNEWALRCSHEALFHEQNCFITLTYDDDLLPEGYNLEDGLEHAHFQKFMKRLRKHYRGKTIKYFMCGEYGGLNERPHFHALLFGIDFDDRSLHSVSGKVKNYISPTLAKLWPFGFHTIGNVHYGTAKYTAKYSLKRMGEEEISYNGRRPEYRKMSHGIGASYAQKYASDIAVHDNIIYNGHINPVPKYYEQYWDEETLQAIKDDRVKFMAASAAKTELELRQSELIAHKKANLYEKPTKRDRNTLHDLRRAGTVA